MVVKTLTITEEAYGRLKMQKHGEESFSEVIIRVVPKKATAADWLGICPGTEEELQADLKVLKKRRIEMSKEIDERVKRVHS